MAYPAERSEIVLHCPGLRPRIASTTRDESQNGQHLLRLGRLALLKQPK
jgi:hypothetical protein